MPGQTQVADADHGAVDGASMEGRAIARPNAAEPAHHRSQPNRFNGGPGNCPAKPASFCSQSGRRAWLQWRAGQLPGQTGGPFRAQEAAGRLQWRAGQLPGQTGRQSGDPRHGPFASMEGRAIARPNSGIIVTLGSGPRSLQWRAGQLPGQTCPITRATRSWPHCFNGGPGNCPAKPVFDGAGQHGGPASMEGRAIARPNVHIAAQSSQSESSLQWRAGQLPGQTSLGCAVAVGLGLASMEGRAIARPNCKPLVEAARAKAASMEGRAIARPNSGSVMIHAASVASLQWRAGQLPGQTRADRGGNAARQPASMEGRAIARPNRGRVRPSAVSTPRLQWRAGQLPGQTCP